MKNCWFFSPNKAGSYRNKFRKIKLETKQAAPNSSKENSPRGIRAILKMCDIFLREDIERLFKGKSVLFMGDSIMRNIYKDLIWLTDPKSDGELIPSKHMCAKGTIGHRNACILILAILSVFR